MRYEYDVVVVGGGHAGCEAAVAAARLGARTLLVTSDLERVAQMSCNPAVGGIAKGQIVREIDALGGMSGIVADATAIQFRMLNRSKGPAVWSPRVQSDRRLYSDLWRSVLDHTDGLDLCQDTVTALLTDRPGEAAGEDGGVGGVETGVRVTGVETRLGIRFAARKVILTAGTFLNGRMHFGPVKEAGGRISEGAVCGLTRQLMRFGFAVGRMKTGTPVRIDSRRIDFSQCMPQEGDDRVVVKTAGTVCDGEAAADGGVCVERDFHKFSHLPDVGRTLMPRTCYIVHTSPEVHAVLRDNLADSPLYNGDIQSIGPRYCPSIETKIVTFADKESHQLFLEPESATGTEFYVNGFSSSLPWRVQYDALALIPALSDVQILRPGYAIEYDYFDPTQLTHDLQTKLVGGLYFAGQICGTTGYEEAAAQGLMAGVNAARAVAGQEPVVLGRDQAYIGVLVDDLVMKGVDEPYRMFTSRAEYRILLRQDNADARLTPLGHEIGLASGRRYAWYMLKRGVVDELMECLRDNSAVPSDALAAVLADAGATPVGHRVRLSELLKRPGVTFGICAGACPAVGRVLDSARRRIASFLETSAPAPGEFPPAFRCASPRAETLLREFVEEVEILVKYEGYIERERQLAEKTLRLEHVRIPAGFAFDSVKALSTEARQKLGRLRPATIGQASRIPGVSPADISVLLLMLRR